MPVRKRVMGVAWARGGSTEVVLVSSEPMVIELSAASQTWAVITAGRHVLKSNLPSHARGIVEE